MLHKGFQTTPCNEMAPPFEGNQPRGDNSRWPQTEGFPSQGLDAQVRIPWLPIVLLALGVILAYSNSLNGPFTYDDYSDLLENTSIRHLWPLRDVFYIPGKGFMSRPVVNLTFALDYAFVGLKPYLFHLTNLGIHLGAALALLGILRRTLILPVFRGRFADSAPTLALVISALWALHPLTTEAVSYITQRYESLMALFVLLTFYCVLRSLESPYPQLWDLLSAVSCLLALGAKEVAVSIPILILLFDRFFVAGSFREAWQKRKVLYLGMVLAWACFAFIQLHAIKRPFAGLELMTPWWRYALNQPSVVLHYLRLSVWPHPLVFDYFWPVARTWRPLLPGLLVLGGLVAFTGWALAKRPRLAFLPICFLAILAPTSSVMPILDLAVEHRMYLPLMPLLLGLVLGVHALWMYLKPRNAIADALARPLVLTGLAVLFSCLGILTYLRNEDFRDPLDLWRSVIQAIPSNPRGHNNYAFNLAEAGYQKEALDHYAKAVALAPGMALFQSNYGLTLANNGRPAEGLEHLRNAVKLEPTNSKFISNLGFVLLMKGSLENAKTCFETARQANPKDELAYAGLATVMQAKHDNLKAKDYIQQAIALNPYSSGIHSQQTEILMDLGDVQGARAAFSASLKLEASAERISDIGWSMHAHSMDREAMTALRQALRMKPGSTKCQIRLAWILATSSDSSVRDGSEAVRLAEQVLHSQSIRSPELLDLLAVSLAEAGRFQEAQAALQEALAQSKDHQEKWIPNLENHLSLFDKNEAFHEKIIHYPAHQASAKSGMQ